MTTLLPPNATALERALEAVAAGLLQGLAVPVRALRDPGVCPLDRLPWLAWERHVDAWRDDWPPGLRRGAVRGSFRRHALAGTPAGDRLILAEAGAVYTYVERAHGHHTVAVRILNSQDLVLGVEDLRRELAAVGRASVRYTVTASAGFAASLGLAGGLGARQFAPVAAALPGGAGGGAVSAVE